MHIAAQVVVILQINMGLREVCKLMDWTDH